MQAVQQDRSYDNSLGISNGNGPSGRLATGTSSLRLNQKTDTGDMSP